MGTRISLRTPAPKTYPGRTRTCNLWFRRPTPYPLGHRASASLAKLVASSPRPYSSRKIEIPRQQGPSPQTCSTSKPKPEHWRTNVALHCVNGTTPHTPRGIEASLAMPPQLASTIACEALCGRPYAELQPRKAAPTLWNPRVEPPWRELIANITLLTNRLQ